MNLSIYSGQRGHSTWSPETFFDLNGDDYSINYDNSCAIVDLYIVTSLPDLDNNMHVQRKRNIQFEILDNYENQNAYIDNKFSDNLLIINTVDPSIENSNFVYNDFLFNRTKAYYFGFKFKDTTTPFHYYTSESYKLFEHPNAETKNQIFVAPNKVRDSDLLHNGTITRRRTHYRKLLVELLAQFDLGYLGNIGQLLYGQGECPQCSLKDLENRYRQYNINKHENPYGYNPPHNEYYRNTFISIYAESIEWGSTIAATEKTFDPLIKRHFILPFSACGFVQHLKQHYGFVFPKFINYEYDLIEDNDSRFKAYAQEVRRLLNQDIDAWRQHWQDNLEILDHNQDIFYQRPYHKVNFESILS